MKKIKQFTILFLILINFSLINVLQADVTVSIELKNNNSVQMALPPDYCDISDLKEGKAHLNNLNKLAPENDSQVLFIKCDSTDGYPWGYIATNQGYVPSSVDPIDVYSAMSGNMQELIDETIDEVNSRSRKLLEDRVEINSMFKNTSGQPTVLWKDKHLLSFGGLMNGTDVNGYPINEYMLANMIIHSNTAIYIYMYSLEDSDDNIYQYPSFFQNFSKSLK